MPLFTAEPVIKELDFQLRDPGFKLKSNTAVDGQVAHSACGVRYKPYSRDVFTIFFVCADSRSSHIAT